MSVSREVVLDLLPLYLSGEASAGSRALIEEYLKGDPDLAERVRVLGAEGFAPTATVDVPPELELRALQRTKRLLGLQRWLFGFAIAFTSVGLAFRFNLASGGKFDWGFLVFEKPLAYGPVLLAGLAFWGVYFALRAKLRTRSR